MSFPSMNVNDFSTAQTLIGCFKAQTCVSSLGDSALDITGIGGKTLMVFIQWHPRAERSNLMNVSCLLNF